MARLVLAHPLFLYQDTTELAASSPYFPLGLLYLAAYVRENGHEVSIFDGTFAADESAFAEHLEAHQPDVVGVSSVITNRATVHRLVATAAARNMTVIVGGPDPTAEPERYLADPNIDIVVHHEGEQTITALLDLHDRDQLLVGSLDAMMGIAFRSNGSMVINDPRPPIEDLDGLPLPARDLIDMDRYRTAWEDDSGYSSITVAATRGCPYGCEWCRDAVHGDRYRRRSATSVATEIQHLKERYGVDSIRIVDDVDGLDRDWIDDWARAAANLDASVPFEPLNRLERTDLPMLEVRDSL